MEDLLAPGLYFLGGSPKVGKSWLALQLCLAVCQGESFLGFHTRKSEVLYLALEDGPRRLHARALRLTEEAPAGLHLYSHAHLIGHGLEQQLDQMLVEHPAVKLVIIDTLQKIREATSASPSYSIDYRDASALKAVADRNDIWYGGRTPLTARLGDEGNLWGPAQLSRYLQSHEAELARCGILVSARRTSKQAAADLLGHADTAFLERPYCHPQDVCKEEAAGLFDSLLAPVEEGHTDSE